MKLIDILVEELPKRGGWPAVALFAMQDSDGLVKFSNSREKIYHDYSSSHVWCSEGGYAWITNGYPFEGCFKVRVAKDNETAFISREQYEAALAASKQGWNGEGLPPVGIDIEYRFPKAKYRNDFSRGRVLAYGVNNVFMEHWSSKNEFIQPLDNIEFRQARSEADKKRDEAIDGMLSIYFSCPPVVDTPNEVDRIAMIALYDAISAGKIPGIRIE